MNIKLINQAVRLKLLERVNKAEYREALARIVESLSAEEFNEYIKRTT